MKRVTQGRGLVLLAALLFTILSCDKEEATNLELATKSIPNIVATVQAADPLRSLVTALMKADEAEGTDLIGTLGTDGPFTVFAPTNEAFTTLLEGIEGVETLADFDTDEEKKFLATILSYHVVGGAKVLSTDLSDAQKISTVQGEEIRIDLTDGVFLRDATEVGAKVTTANIEARNGMVHLIDKILMPQAALDALATGLTPPEELGTLVEIVVATETLSTLKEALVKTHLGDILNAEGPLTIFAPTNDAFAALFEVLGDDYNSLDDFDTELEIDLLKNILRYHLLPEKVLAGDLSPSEVATAFEGNTIRVIESGSTFVIGDATTSNANITYTDIMASNGVAHTIDKVLLPQSTLDFVATLKFQSIIDIAVKTDDASTLVEALNQVDTDLVGLLSSAGPFTVFVPDNHAFEALFNTLGDAYHSISDFDTPQEKALLTTILTYHVLSGTAAFSDDLSNGQKIETAQGEKLGITIKNGSIHIEDATNENGTVTLADIEASNGVIHKISKVLVPQEVLDTLAPPAPTIVALAQEEDDLSILVEALIQADAGLVDALSDQGQFTVFAPSNHAFQDLLHTLGRNYNSIADFNTDGEKAFLAKLLKYHVVADAAVASGTLKDHQELHTLQGESVFASVGKKIKIIDKTVKKGKVIDADNVASNGIVHIIDKVLLPQAILDILNH